MALLSCASVEVLQVENEYGSIGIEREGLEGIRFYRPALHVWLVYSTPSEQVDLVETTKTRKIGDTVETTRDVRTSHRGLAARFVMLPDYTQEYVIRSSSGMGSASASVMLADGWNLTAFSDQSDSQVDELVTSLGRPVASIGPALKGGFEVDDDQFEGPGLYRIHVGTAGKISLGERVIDLGPKHP